MSLSRREFLGTAAALGVTATGGLRPPLALAIDPIKRPSNTPDLKLSLAAYSFRKYLAGKTPSMTLFDFIDLAAGLPLDAVELTSYYFPNPLPADYLDRIKAHAAAKKL